MCHTTCVIKAECLISISTEFITTIRPNAVFLTLIKVIPYQIETSNDCRYNFVQNYIIVQ